jgi:hypothetical protein
MLSANSFSQTILTGDVRMKRLFKILPFCLALVFVFSFSAFAKNNLNQTNKVVVAKVNLVKESNMKNSHLPQKYSEKVNQFKTKCGNRFNELNRECLLAIIDLIVDVINGSDNKELLRDLLDIMKKCGLMPNAEYPNKAKSVLNNTQANLRNFDKHLKKYNSKIKLVNSQSLVTSTPTT